MIRFIARRENLLTYGLIILALAAHYYILLNYALNIPVGDDYWDALRFLNYYDNASSWHEKIGLIFSQHNEHRTAINRFIYIVMYEISGQLNFTTLKLIGDFSTIGLIVLIGAQFKKESTSSFIFAVVAVFLLNLQSWNSMLWAMTSISNYCVATFALASFYALLSKNNSGLYWGIVFAFLATFSMGSGVAIWPIGFLCLFFERKEKRLTNLIIWSASAFMCLGLYFFHYTAPAAIKLPFDIQTTAQVYYKAAIWFFAFLGSCWVFESNNAALAAIIGIFLSISTIPSIIFLKRRAPSLIYFILFILASAAIATYSRFIFFDVTAALSSRYRIYSVYLSCIVLISIYFLLLPKLKNLYLVKASTLIIAIGHTAISYSASFAPMKAEQADVADSMHRWLLLRQEKRFEFSWIQDGSHWIEDAIEARRWDPRGLFSDSLYFYRNKQPDICTRTDFGGDLPFEITRHPQAEAGELAIDDDQLTLDRVRHVIVCRGQRTYVADALEPSRSISGKLIYHYLKIDPIENADSIIFEISTGVLYKGSAGK